MTTVLADAHKGLMVSDSCATCGDRVWRAIKVHRMHGMLVALSGDLNQGAEFLRWWQSMCATKPPRFDRSSALVLDGKTLMAFNGACIPETIRGGIEAIGSGGKAAMCAYQALGFADPVKAVSIVCEHDSGSRKPIRTYRI